MNTVSNIDEVKSLRDFHKDCAHRSPWARFFNLSYDKVMTEYELNGYASAHKLIEQADITAYHREEAYCGDI